MQADGLVDLLVQLAASLHFLRRERAAHAFGLQVGADSLGELLGADKALRLSCKDFLVLCNNWLTNAGLPRIMIRTL